MAVAEKDKYKVNNTALVDKNIASSYNIPLGVSANYSLDLDDLGYENYNYTFVNYNSSNIWGELYTEVSEYSHQGKSLKFATRGSAPYPKINDVPYSLDNIAWWLSTFQVQALLTKNTYIRSNVFTENIEVGVINDDGSEATPFCTSVNRGIYILLQAGGGQVTPSDNTGSNFYGGGGGAACIVYLNLAKANPTITSYAQFRVNRLSSGEIDLDFKSRASDYTTLVKVMPGDGRWGGNVKIINQQYCQVLKTFTGGIGSAPNNNGGNITSNPDTDKYYLNYFSKDFRVCKEYRQDDTRWMTGIGSSGQTSYMQVNYGGAGGSLLSLIETNASLSYRGKVFEGGYGYGATGMDAKAYFHDKGSSIGYILTTLHS